MHRSWSPLSRSRRPSNSRRKLQARHQRISLESLEQRVVLAAFTWNGDAGHTWETPGAWLADENPTNSLPGAADDVSFDETSIVSVVTPAALTTVRSLKIDSGYTGTLSLDGDFKANYGFIQNNGIFNAGAHTLTVGRDLTVSGGTFNAGTSSVVIFPGPIGASSKVDASGVAFHNVTLDLGSHHVNVGNLDVNGTLTLKGFNTLTGTIQASGNIITSAGGKHGNLSSGKIVIDGTGAQQLRTENPDDTNGFLPSIEIAKPNGTLSLIGGLNVQGNWTQTSGGLNAGSSTVTFMGGTYTVDTGNRSLNNVAIDTGVHHFNVKKLDVNGDLTIKTATNITFPTGVSTGALTVAGDLTSLDSTVSSNASIVMDGTGHVKLNGPGDFPNGGLIINKGVYNVTVADMEKPLDSNLTIESIANLHGELLVAKDVITKDSGVAGNGSIVFSGTGNQKLTAEESGDQVPGVKINKEGGTLTLDPAQTIGVTGNWLHTSGTVNVAGSTIELKPTGHTTVDTGTGMAFNNLIVDIAHNYWLTADTNMTVDGELTIRTVNAINGTVVARGNVTTEDASVGGTGLLTFSGNKSQTLKSTVNHGQVPSVKIDKTGATLTLDASSTIGVTGGWDYVKGGLNAAGSTISLEGNAHRTVNTGPTANTALNNVEIAMSTYTLTATRLDVNGSLTIHSVAGINGALGAVTVAGNLTSNDDTVAGTANVTMDGNINAQVTGGDFPNGGIVLQKGSAQSVTASVSKPLDGPLTINSVSSLNGTFHVGNNVITSDTGVTGNGVLVFAGTGNQKLTATVAGAQVPGVEINKSSGTFTVDSANRVGVTGPQGWTQVEGNVVTTGSTVEFRGVSKAVKATTPFNHVILNMGSADLLTATAMTVNGNLTITSLTGIDDTIQARGDVTTGDLGVGGSGTILFNGTGAQTFSASADGAQVPNVRIDKASGTLTVAGPNAIGVTRNWTHVDGTVDTTGSTVQFRATSKTVNDGGYAFDNVILNMGSADLLTAASMTVNGDLTITSLTGINGTIDVHGNVTSTDTGVGGNGVIQMVGSKDASLSGGDLPNGGLVIDKTEGAAVSLSTNLALSALAVDSGVLDFDTHVLTVSGNTSVGANGTLKFTLVPSTTQLKVNGANLTFAEDSTIEAAATDEVFAEYNLISVTGGSLVDNGVEFAVPAGVTPAVTGGLNGKVTVVKTS